MVSVTHAICLALLSNKLRLSLKRVRTEHDYEIPSIRPVYVEFEFLKGNINRITDIC